MSSNEIKQYVVTFHYQETGLTEILELSSALLQGGFSTTLNDNEGHPHELGTNSFGITSALSQQEIHQQALSVGELILGSSPEVEVQSWEAFRASKA